MILMKETFNEKKEFFDNFNMYVDDVSLSQYTERGAKISDLDENSLSQYYHQLSLNKLPIGTAYLRDAYGNIKLANGRKPCEQPFPTARRNLWLGRVCPPNSAPLGLLLMGI